MAFRTLVLCLDLALVPTVVENAALPAPTSADTAGPSYPTAYIVVIIAAAAIGGLFFWFFFRRRRQQRQPAHA
jgi:type II secretory pathway component PulF